MRIPTRLRSTNHIPYIRSILGRVHSSGNVVVGLLFLLALTLLFCTTALRSVIQAHTAASAHRHTVTARAAAEGVIRIVRALYAAHTQEIYTACIAEGQELSLALGDGLEKTLTSALPASRIITNVFFSPAAQCIVADIQIVHTNKVPCMHVEVCLDSVVSAELPT